MQTLPGSSQDAPALPKESAASAIAPSAAAVSPEAGAKTEKVAARPAVQPPEVKKAAARKRSAARQQLPAAPVAAPALAETPKPRVRKKAAAAPVLETPAPSEKPGKLKLVRDNFTMPREEYAAIDLLKARALEFNRAAKKSELVRAGLKLLVGLNDAALQRALAAVAPVKAGRADKPKEAKAKTAKA